MASRIHSDQVTRVHIEWSEALDVDNDLIGYKVFISRKSLGWGYGKYTGPAALKKFLSHSDGWKPDMYEKLYQVPPHEERFIETKQQLIDLEFRSGEAYFITVMPYAAPDEAWARSFTRCPRKFGSTSKTESANSL